MPPPPPRSRAAARRRAEALFARAGDALTTGVRVVTGRRPQPESPTAPTPPSAAAAVADPAPAGEPPRPAPTGEEAAARIDAARERLRAKIAPPADEDDPSA